MTATGVPVWTIAAALPIVLLVAWGFATLARWILRGRARLGTATSIVVAILSSSVGLFVAGLVDPSTTPWSPLTLALTLGMTVLGIAAYGAVAAHVQRPVQATVPELLVAGESDQVEFKSTARVNLHTGAKDPRIERVIAKAVCGFLNGDGGTLLIGVDDTGTPLGLAADFATLKSPDADRFELWLRDLLTESMGQNAAAQVGVEFVALPGDDGGEAVIVCRVTCRPSPRPVYVKTKGSPPEFWVRSGNSTRQLTVDEATGYVMHRWPLSLGSTLAAQVKAAVRFSGDR